MAPHIRDYADGDHAAVSSLVEAVLAEYGFSAIVGRVERDLLDIPERYAAPHAGFWVADDHGAVVGTVAIRPMKENKGMCEIKRLYVRADRRGTGLGRTLYHHAEAFARAAGYERIWLMSSRRFVKARELYEKNGFVLTEEVDNDWEDNLYEKDLVVA